MLRVRPPHAAGHTSVFFDDWILLPGQSDTFISMYKRSDLNTSLYINNAMAHFLDFVLSRERWSCCTDQILLLAWGTAIPISKLSNKLKGIFCGKYVLGYLPHCILDLALQRILCSSHIFPPLRGRALLLLCLQNLTAAGQSILLAQLDAPSQNQMLLILAQCPLPALLR